MAQHLLRDGARSPRSRGVWSRAASRRRATPTRRRIDRAGFVLSTAAMAPADLHDHRGPEPWLGQRAERSRGFALTGACWQRVRRLGAAHRRSRCSTSALFRNPRFTAASGSVDGRVLLAVRVHLPDDPVLPVHQGLRPAVDRRAPAPGRDVAWRSPRCSAPSSRSASARSSSSPTGLFSMACLLRLGAHGVGHAPATARSPRRWCSTGRRHGPDQRAGDGGDHGRRARRPRPASARPSTTRRGCSAAPSASP